MGCVDPPEVHTETRCIERLEIQWEEAFPFTLLAVASLVAGAAHTVTRHAESMTPTLWIDTLRGRHVALCALPTAVTLTAPPGVLAVPTAQDRTGS